MRSKTTLLILLLSFVFVSCGGSKSSEVRIFAPLKAKFAAKNYKRVYLADFIIYGEHAMDKTINININKEIKETLKSEFKDKSHYEIEDLKIEYAKDKKPAELLQDSAFWASQKIPAKQETLILTGAVEFSNYAKSGLVTEQVTNPRTGGQRNVTTSRERMQLVMAVDLYLLDAVSGNKLFQETFREEEVYDDVSNVNLSLFYDIFERIAPKIVGVIVPYRITGARILLEP